MSASLLVCSHIAPGCFTSPPQLQLVRHARRRWGFAYDNTASVVPDAGLGWALLYYAWTRSLTPQSSSCAIGTSVDGNADFDDNFYDTAGFPSTVSVPR